MARRRKIIAWGVGLGLLVGVASSSRSEEPEKQPTVTIEADHEPLLTVIKKICATQGLNFVANDAAIERAGKISLSLHDVPLEQALDVICDAYSLEAHVRSRILVVRPREGSSASPAPAGERHEPARNRYLPEEPRAVETPSEHRKPEAAPPVASEPAAPVASHVAPASGGHLIVGTVVEIAKDSVKVKESSGEPRELHLPTGEDEAERASRLALALKRLKVGDRVALEYRILAGRCEITNLVGGGNPQGKP